MKVNFKGFNRRLDVSSNINKILIKLLPNSCGSFKLRPLSNVLGRVMLGNSFKKDSFFIPSHELSTSFGCFGNNF